MPEIWTDRSKSKDTGSQVLRTARHYSYMECRLHVTQKRQNIPYDTTKPIHIEKHYLLIPPQECFSGQLGINSSVVGLVQLTNSHTLKGAQLRDLYQCLVKPSISYHHW